MTKPGTPVFFTPKGFKFPRLPGARCESGIEPDDFFAERSFEKRKRDRTKAFCNPCSVRTECLLWALEHREQFGIWGGLDTRERRLLLKQRRNG